MATSDGIRVGLNQESLDAIDRIQTETGAMSRLIYDAANRGQVLELRVGGEVRTMVWNAGAGKFEEVIPNRRKSVRINVASLEDFADVLERWGDGPTVQVSPHGIHADLRPEDPDHEDLAWLELYLDPVITNQARGRVEAAELIRELERLQSAGGLEEEGVQLLELLRFLKVEQRAGVDVAEHGAHTRVTTQADTTVQGVRKGKGVDIPKEITARVSIGTRWTVQDVRLRIDVAVSNGLPKFLVSLANQEQVAKVWMDTAAEFLSEHSAQSLVVRAERLDSEPAGDIYAARSL